MHIHLTERQNIDLTIIAEQHVNVINIEDGELKKCKGNGSNPKNILSNGELRNAIES